MKAAVAVAFALLAIPAPAGPVHPKDGSEVMDEVDKRRRTMSEYSEGVITVDEKGKTRQKAWRSWRLGWGQEAKGLIQFQEPAEVKGVGLLTLSHTGRSAEQWFYAPAIDRDRRVAKQEKSTRFLGTHFTYEDMEERDVNAYAYTLLRDDTIAGAPCFTVEAKPAPEEESQYSKLVFWVLQDRYVTIRVEAYVDGALRRVFEGSDVREESGIPIVHQWLLTDTKRPGLTRLAVANVRIDPKLDGTLFTVGGMRTIHPKAE
jgi:outer membrane lipoprotein-sorting protein